MESCHYGSPLLMKVRFIIAMACYGVLALLSAFTLDDWRFRAAVWVVLGGLAVKTWVARSLRD
jgi:predicted membrane channel-forming protein YqfA (hemolysin III family)